MVFRPPISIESVMDSHRGDEMTNRHRVGHHIYLQSLCELLLMEFVASSHCPMVFRTPISMKSLADSHRGGGLTNRHRVGHRFYFQPLSELLLMEFMALSHCPLALRTSVYVVFIVCCHCSVLLSTRCRVGHRFSCTASQRAACDGMCGMSPGLFVLRSASHDVCHAHLK